MVRTTLAAIWLLVAAHPVASADYAKVASQPDATLMLFGYEVQPVQQPEIVGRLAYWLAKNTECKDPALLAELLAATKYPKELAGIYKAEDNPDGTKIGPCGELGPFQFMPDEPLPDNYNPLDLEQNVKWAERKLEDKIREEGSVREGVRAYNGSSWNPKARAYRDRVLQAARGI